MRPRGLREVVLLMCLLNPTGLLFARSSFEALLVGMCIAIGYAVLWFLWRGRNWARWLVLLTSVVALLNLVALPSATLVQRTAILLEAIVGVFLLYWLNTGAVRAFFSAGSSTGRTIGVLAGACLLLAILAAGAGYTWWQTQGLALKAEGEASIAEGSRFGKSTDNRGCMDESLERFDRCQDGFACNVKNNVFFLNCLKASSPVAGFCDGVPATDSLAESVAWRLKQCEQFRRAGTHCGNFFGQVQEYCASPSLDGQQRAESLRTSPSSTASAWQNR